MLRQYTEVQHAGGRGLLDACLLDAKQQTAEHVGVASSSSSQMNTVQIKAKCANQRKVLHRSHNNFSLTHSQTHKKDVAMTQSLFLLL